VLGAPELDAGLQVGSHQGRAVGTIPSLDLLAKLEKWVCVNLMRFNKAK